MQLKLSDLNVFYKDKIEKIGSTNGCIWLKARSSYFKLIILQVHL